MVVMKFGGTSLADARCIRQVAEIVASRLIKKPLVVVSAMAGMTNDLLRLLKHVESGQPDVTPIVQRHCNTARALGLSDNVIKSELRSLDRTVQRLKLKTHLTARNRDLLLSYGERLSARIVAAALSKFGIPACPVMSYSAGLLTDNNFGSAEPLPDALALLGRSLKRVSEVPVITGFLGCTRRGAITTLGRGGSDFSAALVGAAVSASLIEIWTDVNGVMSADPRVVSSAHTIPHLSFAEGAELAYFGAKVLHPKTLLPAMERNIPVRVVNTNQPGHSGTLITREIRSSKEIVKAIACKKDITVMNIVSTRMLLAHGFLARLFEVFARHRIVVDVISTSEVSVSVTIDRICAKLLRRAVTDLERIAAVEIKPNRALVSIIGSGLARQPGVAGKVFSILGQNDINIEMISQGASKINLSLVVHDRQADNCVQVLHRRLFGGTRENKKQ